MSSRSYGQFCALAQALDRVGERWTLLVIRELLAGPARFRELSDALPGLASNLLTQRLRGLEEDGLVVRRVLPPPAGVNVYELTGRGRELEPVLFALARWGWPCMPDVPYVDPGGPRGLIMALRVSLPQQIAARAPVSVALRLTKDEIGIRVTAEGKVDVALGRPPGPDAVLEMAYRTAYRLIGGRLTVGQGIEQGVITIQGERDPGAWAVLDDLLRQRSATSPGDSAAPDGSII